MAEAGISARIMIEAAMATAAKSRLYIKFAKTTNGWQADHLNYRQTFYPADPDPKCE
jgi:hypothetical protein